MTNQRTLAVDIGGTGIKAVVFDADGNETCEPVRISTPYPCPPSTLIDAVAGIAAELPQADRVAAGFPGLVRSDRVVWVNSLTRAQPGAPTDPTLAELWVGFPLQQALGDALALPTLVVNDADVHALASVTGQGLECVVTLGTGFGFSLALDGQLLPHLEFGGLPFDGRRDYDTALGQPGLDEDGVDAWIHHVEVMVDALRQFLYFDHLFIGGGNARLLPEITFGGHVTRVANTNGLLGGHLLWVGRPVS